jgi:hypothetical protein
LQVIRERDLADEWAIAPIAEAEYSSLNDAKYDSSIMKVPTYAELLSIASEDLGK